MNYPYGKQIDTRKVVWYVDDDEKSIRDFTRAYKPTEPGRFADWLIKKYPKWRGLRDRVLLVIEDELKKLPKGDAAS